MGHKMADFLLRAVLVIAMSIQEMGGTRNFQRV